MSYNPYGGNPYGQPPGYNPYPGANQMGYPGSAPPGMSPAPGMSPPPGVHSASQTNRPSGLPPSFQPPPNINFNAPVIRLGGANGPKSSGSPVNTNGNGMGMGVPGAPTGPSGGASSLPARPNPPHSAHSNGNYGGRRGGEQDSPMSAGGPPMRPDFRSGGGDRYDNRYDNRYEPRGDRYDRYERDNRNDRDRGDRNDRDRHDRGPGGGDRDRDNRAPNGNLELQRAAVRDNMHANVPPTNDEKLKTIFVHKVPDGVGGEAGLERLLSIVGRLRRFDAATSHLADHEGKLFAFAQYEDIDSLASAIELLKEVKVPVKKQEYKEKEDKTEKKEDGEKEKTEKKSGDESNGHGEEKKDKKEEDIKNDKDAKGDDEDPYKNIRKTTLQVAVDPVTLQLVETHQEKQSDEAKAEAKARLKVCKAALKTAVHKLFFPPPPQEARKDANGDIIMGDGSLDPMSAAAAAAGIDILHIPLPGQEDELSEVPEEMRAMVASEIASFRDRSTQRDLERLKREQEMEELERRRNGDEPLTNGKSRGAANNDRYGDRHADRERERPRRYREDPDTDASDDELFSREQRKQQNEEEKQYQEAERKWANRERQRAAALDREKDRDRAEGDNAVRHREEALAHDKAWDDERESQRKTVLYYRDHAAWQRKRTHERADEEAKDAADRRAEEEEQRKQAAEMEAARGMADSFLAQQAEEMDVHEDGPAKASADSKSSAASTGKANGDSAPQKVTISFGAAAQRNQAQRAVAPRRTVAEVEGLLDDEEQDDASKRRQLIPINFEPISASARMSDEELNQAVRSLAQEIPTEREGLWAWPVAWSFVDKDESSIIRDKLRPFVEKKVVEYLGVQEQFLVEVVEQHLRKHGSPQDLVEELQEALDEAAEDLVKKLWRMVIFFTESEKRGLPA